MLKSNATKIVLKKNLNFPKKKISFYFLDWNILIILILETELFIFTM